MSGQVRQRIGFWSGLGFLAAVLALAPLDGPAMQATLGVGGLMAIWWMTEALPLAITALLPVALLPLLGAADGKELASAYFNDVIFLFMGGFIMALALEKTGLHRRIALWVLSKASARAGSLLAGFMGATALLSMWISNTAAAMMMVPVALSVARQGELGKASQALAPALLLGVAYAASIGGLATLVGTPPNLSLVRIHAIHFPEAATIGFGQWMLFALPLAALMLLAAWAILRWLHLRALPDEPEARRQILAQQAALGPMDADQRRVLALFALLALLWTTRAPLDFGAFRLEGWGQWLPRPEFVNDGTVAVALASLLFVLPSRRQPGQRLMDLETAMKLPWPIVLLFGGGFALAGAFKSSGLSLWMGERLAGLEALPPLALVLVVSLAVSLLTELTSNTATTELLLPVMAGMSQVLGLPPLLLMVATTLSASLAFMLPVATPPNAIVFGSNLLTMRQMFRAGLLLNFAGVLLVAIFTYFWGPRVLPF